jgi:hypothetical protein
VSGVSDLFVSSSCSQIPPQPAASVKVGFFSDMTYDIAERSNSSAATLTLSAVVVSLFGSPTSTEDILEQFAALWHNTQQTVQHDCDGQLNSM